MKLNIEFLQTGGVPLTNDLMAVLQDAYSTYEVLGDLAGDKTILKGCEVNGSLVNPGIVVINGEVLPFEGGLLATNVFVNLEEISETFQDQTNKILVRKKTVKFGLSSVTYNWSDFVYLETLKQLQIKINNGVTQQQFNSLVAEVELLKLKTAPIINGGIVWAWNKPENEIPAGWKECIDFRGKTILGRDPNDAPFSILGNTGGSKTKVITKQNLPNLSTSFDIAHPYSGSFLIGGGFDGGPNLWRGQTVNINPGGTSQPFDVMNPFRIVNFIEPNLP